MRRNTVLLSAVLFALVSALGYAQAPVPFINLPLVPDATPPGGPQFTLTVNGTGFVSNSVVNWNGNALPTQFVRGSQLTATVPAANIATASTASVTVVNQGPGVGASNVVFFSVAPNQGNWVGLGLAWSPAAGGDPESVAVGDFNGDGKLDLAVASYMNNTVSIFLGDGKGNFTLASSLVTGTAPDAIAVGDFNGDGKLDLAVANSGGNAQGAISILLGDGMGNFTQVSSGNVSNPVAVAVGDFNGDGKSDLAVVNPWFRTVSILLGDGTGNFTLASSPRVGLVPWSIAVGDFNGDGRLDLAVANGACNDCVGTVSILLGDGTGNFTLTSSPVIGDRPESIAAADFNGDGNLDLAVADSNSGTVSILLGDGTGNFTVGSSPGLYCGTDSVAVGDFNGDGIPDLAIGAPCDVYEGVAFILLGDGTGNFAVASAASTGGLWPWSVAVGDFNGDGKPDVVVTNLNSGTISILLQDIPAAGMSPASLSFETQLVGSNSSRLGVTLTNTGAAMLSIASIAPSANFHEANNCGSGLAIGASCTIYVSFNPHHRGILTGSITITDNAPNSPQTVPLTGVGTVMTLSPSSLDFGSQMVGTTSAPQTVTLTNHATAAVSIFGVRVSGSNPGAFAQTNTCGTSVPAGGSCAISVTFTPRHPGSKGATLGVGDSGGASPQTVTLSGTGT